MISFPFLSYDFCRRSTCTPSIPIAAFVELIAESFAAFSFLICSISASLIVSCGTFRKMYQSTKPANATMSKSRCPDGELMYCQVKYFFIYRHLLVCPLPVYLTWLPFFRRRHQRYCFRKSQLRRTSTDLNEQPYSSKIPRLFARWFLQQEA